MLGRILCAGLLSAALCLIPQPSPVQLNNSVEVQTPEKVAQTATSKADEINQASTTPVVPANSQQPSPQTVKTTEPETQPTQTKAVVQAPVLTPKEQAKATLEDLGHGDAWYAVEYIGFKESSWNPAAINEIGACGLFQALPCEKMNCELSDVPCQVRWATKYATQRYGTWHNAYAFWKKNNWW